jgi:hypothetical protein
LVENLVRDFDVETCGQRQTDRQTDRLLDYAVLTEKKQFIPL